MNYPRRRRVLTFAILFWTALALFETWPLILNLNTHIFGYPGDPFFTIRAFHIAAEGMQQGRPFRWFWLGTHLPTYLPGVILTRLLCAASAYNLLMLISFPLAGVTMFLLAHYLTGDRLVSFVAGTAYAFCPYHLAHATAHLDLSHIEWLPLVFLFLLRCADHPSVGRITLLTASCLLAFFGNYYYGFFVAIAATLLLISDILVHLATKSGALKRLINYGRTLIAPIIVAAISLPFAWHIISNRLAYARDIRDVFRFAARLRDYVVPSPPFTLFGEPFANWVFVRIHNSYHSEQSLFLGFTLLTLAVIGIILALRSIWAVRKQASARDRANILGVGIDRAPTILSFGITGLLCLVISFPPVIDLCGTAIKMPSYYLYILAPMFRFYSRMAILVQLCVIAVASYGLHCVGRPFQAVRGAGTGRSEAASSVDPRTAQNEQETKGRFVNRRYRYVIILVSSVLILAEFIVLPGGHLTSVAPRPVDEFIAGLPGRGKVLEVNFALPSRYGTLLFDKAGRKRFFKVPLVQIALLHQLTHHKAIVTPKELIDNDIITRSDYKRIEKLRELGVEYIVYEGSGIAKGPGYQKVEDPLVAFYRNSPEVRLVREFGTHILFEVLPGPKVVGPATR